MVRLTVWNFTVVYYETGIIPNMKNTRKSHCVCVCVCVCVYVAGEMLSVAEQFLEQQMHPTVIISAYRQALEDMLDTLTEIRYTASHTGL